MITKTAKQHAQQRYNQNSKARRYAEILQAGANHYSDKTLMFMTVWWKLSALALEVRETSMPPSWPEPIPEYQFNAPETKHAFDWAWPYLKVAVEVDGGQYAPGGGRHAHDSDKLKGNLAAAMGWLVFHFSPQMLEHEPEMCVRQVQEAILIRKGKNE